MRDRTLSYDLYLWHWAANDVPGRIEPILNILDDAAAPESITPFPQAPFRDALQRVIGPPVQGDELRYECEVIPARDASSAVLITLGFPASVVARVVPLVARIAEQQDLVAYDPQECCIVPPCHPKQFGLERQNRPPVYDPTWEEIAQALRSMQPRGACYVILTNRHGDYLQVAGAPAQLTLEWRKLRANGFQHCVGGKLPSASGTVRIRCDVGPITVCKHQALTLDDILPVFQYFFAGEPIDALLEWEDVTPRFTQG